MNGTYTEPSKAAYFRSVAGKLVATPGGGERRFSAQTMAYWEWLYQNGGFEALRSQGRSDRGGVRALTDDQVAAIEALRARFPKAPATKIREIMVADGTLDEGGASASTFQRYFRAHPADRGREGAPAKDRKAFEAGEPCEIWQADTLYGPYVHVRPDDARARRAYLQMVVDDCTRMVVGARFWDRDDAANFQRVLMRAVATHGIPRRLLVDNGGPYRNLQLTGICGRIGCALVHAPVRDGACKGKIERLNRTLRDGLLRLIGPDERLSLEGLNDRLGEWVAKYNRTPHSSLGGRSPMEAWGEGVASAPPRTPESEGWLAAAFRSRERRRVNGDATVRVAGVLHDAPSHLVGASVDLEFTPWDPSDVWLVDDEGGRFRLQPTDKRANARAKRDNARYRLDWGEAS